jgi:hypothetical protein
MKNFYKNLPLFVIIFIFINLQVACNKGNLPFTASSAIRKVLQQDAQFSTERREKERAEENESGKDYSSKLKDRDEPKKEYYSKMKDIDTSNCPSDFQIAFRHHVDAWNSLSHYGIWHGTEGYSLASEDVTSTWREVEKVAAKYDVVMPE